MTRALDPNAVTLRSYEDNADAYLETLHEDYPAEWYLWLEAVADRLTGPRVLEIGSCSGRNASYLEKMYGLEVQRTDASHAFVSRLTAAGHDARQLDVLKDKPGEMHHGVFACAVFHHLTDEGLATALSFSARSLLPDGILAFCVRRGYGDEWESGRAGAPRYFRFWQPWSLWQLTEGYGFRVLSAEAQDWSRPGKPYYGGHSLYPDQWVMMICQKRML